MEINIQSLLWGYTAIISGQLASVSVTSKSIIKIPTEKNTNFFFKFVHNVKFLFNLWNTNFKRYNPRCS